MTLPTQTWRISKKYAISISSSMTPTEMFTGLKSMFDAEDALGNNYWTYGSQSISGSDCSMMFKRKGSPGGTLGTFRAGLLTSTATPAAANMGLDVTATAARAYGVSSQDHNSDSFASTFQTAAVLNGSYCKGVVFGNTMPNSNFTNLTGVYAFFVECDRMCSIWITNANTTFAATHFTFGEIVERAADSVGLWGHFTSRGDITVTQYGHEAASINSIFPFTDNTATQVGGMIWDGAAKGLIRGTSGVADMIATPLDTENFQNQNNDTAILFPVIASSKAAAGTTNVFGLGVFRQMKFSIRHVGVVTLRDANSNVMGYSVSPSFGTVSRAIFYTQTA